MSEEKTTNDEQAVITDIDVPIVHKYNFTAGAAPARPGAGRAACGAAAAAAAAAAAGAAACTSGRPASG